jgi:hypothetical protein
MAIMFCHSQCCLAYPADARSVKCQTRPTQAERLCLRLQLLLDLAAVLDALQNILTVLVELQLGDDDF